MLNVFCADIWNVSQRRRISNIWTHTLIWHRYEQRPHHQKWYHLKQTQQSRPHCLIPGLLWKSPCADESVLWVLTIADPFWLWGDFIRKDNLELLHCWSAVVTVGLHSDEDYFTTLWCKQKHWALCSISAELPHKFKVLFLRHCMIISSKVTWLSLWQDLLKH